MLLKHVALYAKMKYKTANGWDTHSVMCSNSLIFSMRWQYYISNIDKSFKSSRVPQIKRLCKYIHE